MCLDKKEEGRITLSVPTTRRDGPDAARRVVTQCARGEEESLLFSFVGYHSSTATHFDRKKVFGHLPWSRGVFCQNIENTLKTLAENNACERERPIDPQPSYFFC